MNIFSALLLGLVQGITEFLPVSSSAHLVIVQHFLPGFNQPGILFDVVLHLGTVAAVLFFFRKRLFVLGIGYYKLLIIGSIPAAILGFIFADTVERMFSGLGTVGIELILTGVLNIAVDRVKTKKASITNSKSFFIGIAQALAIIPGISRSGATIFGGVIQGIDRQKAAEFSFLLSVPAILGANLLQFISHAGSLNGSNPAFYFAGFVAALVSGFVSIYLVLRTLSQRKFTMFGIYCLVLGFFVSLI